MTNRPDGPPVVPVPGQLHIVGTPDPAEREALLAKIAELEQEQTAGKAAAVGKIAETARSHRNVGAELDQAVTDARAWGATWQEIADAAGVTRQTAWKRWGIR